MYFDSKFLLPEGPIDNNLPLAKVEAWRRTHDKQPLSGPLSNKRTGVLPQDPVKSRRREIGCYNDRIALKFDRHLGSTAAEVPVKFQSNWKSLNMNLAAPRLNEILRP